MPMQFYFIISALFSRYMGDDDYMRRHCIIFAHSLSHACFSFSVTAAYGGAPGYFQFLKY